MSKNREIEAKTLLDKTIFEKIKHDLIKKVEFNQENYYFDTRQDLLKEHKISCRIRIFSNKAEQTLKVPDLDPVQKNFHEVIEINDELTRKEALNLIEKAQKQGYLNFSKNVGQYLNQHFKDVKDKLVLFTWSKTKRLLANGPKNCELTLDSTTYPDGYCDYELEIENSDPKLIQEVLKDLQTRYHFESTKENTNQNKIARASQHRK